MNIFLLILLVIVLFNTLVYILDNNRQLFKKEDNVLNQMKEFEIEEPSKRCPPHKWSYRPDNKMQCTICGFVAGTHNNDFGNYGM